LEQDPKHCGTSQHTLVCENNITVLDQPASGKFYVRAINYDNQTIWVVDPGLFQKNNCSSIPHNRLPAPSSSYIYTDGDLSTPVFFLKCTNPVNSSMYVDTAPCINITASSLVSVSQPKTYGYVKVGNMDAGDLDEGCSMEWTAMLQLKYSKDYNASYQYIHNALAYGFELHYLISEPCEQWSTNAKCFPRSIGGA
jgi:hypothetical protein